MQHIDDLIKIADPDFDQVINRRGSSSSKWNKYQGEDVLPLWVADMDFRSPPEIIEALQARVDHGIFGYSEVPESLIDLIVRHLNDFYDWQIHPDWLCWIAAVVPGINMAARVTGQNNEPILMPVPTYHPILDVPRHSGRPRIKTRLVKNNGRWEMDLDQLDEDLARSGGDLVILCNPQNPTGRVYTQTELQAFAEIVLKRGAIICSDEIHCDLLIQPGLKHLPLANLGSDVANSTITLMAPTKTFNMPGLNFAFAVIPNPELRRNYRHARIGMQPSLSPLAMVAAETAYAQGHPWLQRLQTYLRGNAHIVQQKMSELGVPTTEVEATCLAWLDLSAYQLDNPAKYFEQQGLGLSDGKQFDGDGFLRLNFGCPRETLYQALQRFEAAIAGLNAH